MVQRQESGSIQPTTLARVAGHPIHPMIVSLPLGLFTATLASDIAFSITDNSFWAFASRWLLAGALIGALLAAIPGLVDLLGVAKARRSGIGWIHAGTMITAVGLGLANVLLRIGGGTDATTAVLPVGLALSAATVAVMATGAWFGGEMVYVRGIGFGPRGAETMLDVTERAVTTPASEPATTPTAQEPESEHAPYSM